MCTNYELMEQIRQYVEISDKIADLEKAKKAASVFIIGEMETRGTDTITVGEKDYKIITDRANENVTAAGKDLLKATFDGSEIDTYISVTISRYPAKAACKRLLNQ